MHADPSERNNEKRAIRAAFGAAARRYDAVAHVQRRIAGELIQLTPHVMLALDAGCGTGFGAQLLAQHLPEGARIMCLDAAQGMCRQTGRSAVCADIEQLPLASASLPLYWSSLAWQWTNPLLAAREAFRALAPGGELRVATLGPDTLKELRQSFRHVDAHSHVRSFDDLDSHQRALQLAGFSTIAITRTTERVWANDIVEQLRALRTLGAHTLSERRRGLMSRSAWQRLCAAHEAHRTPAGLPTSYDVLYLQARKPEVTA